MSVYAYIRASTAKQVSTPEVQRHTIAEYAAPNGLKVDAEFVDSSTSGKKCVFDREAGHELMVRLHRGDHIIVAKLDRLSRSLIDFVHVLESWNKQGVILHVCDFPGGRFNPDDPMMALLIHILMSFAQFERSLISSRTKEGHAELKALGWRQNNYAAWGYKWEQRYDQARKRPFFVAVPHEPEQKVMMHAVQLRAEGHTIDQIRQLFNYKFNYRTRKGMHFSTRQITDMIKTGLQQMKDSTFLQKEVLDGKQKAKV